jgi:hypothetical protein
VCALLQHAGRELGAAIDSYRRVTAVHAYEDTVCTSTNASTTTSGSVAAALAAAATAVASCILSVCSSMSLWYIEPSSGSMWVVTDNNGNSNANSNGYNYGSDDANNSTGKTSTHLMRVRTIKVLCRLVLVCECIAYFKFEAVILIDAMFTLHYCSACFLPVDTTALHTSTGSTSGSSGGTVMISIWSAAGLRKADM